MRVNYNYDDNFMTLADSYKTSHWAFYPPKTSFMASYLESRGGMFDTTLWNGLQPILKQYFTGQVITEEKIEEAYQEWGEHFGDYTVFNRAGWEYILNEHDGYLPLRIKQAPEGSVIPVSNIMAMVENTDEENCAWLTNYVETVLLHVWFPTTVGTLSREIKKVQIKSLMETSDLTDEEINGVVSFMLHDFGFRGTSSVQSAAAGGAAHLINYMGTDTFVATRFIKQFYNTSNMTGFSIRATEHSTVMLWKEEMQMMKRLITETPEAAFVACVSDTYDIVNAVKNIWGGELKDNIMERNGRLVIRPDCYDDETSILTENGWKLFKDLDETDLVAQVLDDGSYEFVKPLEYIEKEYKGVMYHFHDFHGKVDLLVTPNHRMVYTNNLGELKIQEAKDCSYYHNKNMLRSAKAKNNFRELTALEALKIAFQADGSYTTSGNKIRFSFSKERKVERLTSIINDIGVEYKTYNLSNGNVEFNINLDASNFTKDFSWVNIRDLDANWCQEFIEELSYWDSTRRHENRFKFDTTVKSVIDVVEYVALAAGYGVLITESNDDRKEHFLNTYTAHILKNNQLGGQAITKEEIEYEGNVYCVRVPSGKLLVKRGRGTAVCGNCGDPLYTLGVIFDILWEKFGEYGHINSKGYRVLPPQIRVIQGDGVNYNSIKEILTMLAKRGYSTENIVFGMGGALLQKLDRDTQKFAIKACTAIIDGEVHDVQKSPMEFDEDGNYNVSFKKSKKGYMKLVLENGEYRTVTSEDPNFDSYKDELEIVFEDGQLIKEYKFQDIRDRAAISLEELKNEPALWV